ncbi:MAG TPA: hypothetical protein VED87_05670 [Methylocystis sp.]|nr:hypothetical protein [Methylocystis sp.]
MSAPSSGLAQETGSGFAFCVAPAPPACIDVARTKPERTACEKLVSVCVRSVYQYRACLEAETQRAVLQSNDALDRWRCRRNGAPCPGLKR